jgi:hypothetical protein
MYKLILVIHTGDRHQDVSTQRVHTHHTTCVTPNSSVHDFIYRCFTHVHKTNPAGDPQCNLPSDLIEKTDVCKRGQNTRICNEREHMHLLPSACQSFLALLVAKSSFLSHFILVILYDNLDVGTPSYRDATRRIRTEDPVFYQKYCTPQTHNCCEGICCRHALTNYGKGKVVPLHGKEALWVRGGIAPTLS